MKEIISFLVPKDLCEGCTKDCRKMLKDKTLCYLSREPYALVENKVPTNWEELKELCEDLEGKGLCIINDEDCIEIGTATLGYNFGIFKDGSIFTDTDVCIAEKLSIPRCWNFIKSLIGEE